MVTIEEVAKDANVSIASVSYAMNNKTGVSKKTKKRIIESAEKLGYIPNSLAQSLLTDKTNVIGLVIPGITGPFRGQFVDSLTRYAQQSGYYLMIGITDGKVDREKEIIKTFISKMIDALIIVPDDDRNNEFYAQISKLADKRNLPFLIALMHIEDVNASFVTSDHMEGHYMLASYLFNCGYKDIVYTNVTNKYYHLQKSKGFKKAAAEAGVDVRIFDVVINEIYDEYKIGCQFMKNFFENGEPLPQLFIAATSMFAYGMVNIIHEHGLRIPEDVGITGFDSSVLPEFEPISLTTVSTLTDSISRYCVEVVCAENYRIREIIVKPELIIGESTLSSV